MLKSPTKTKQARSNAMSSHEELITNNEPKESDGEGAIGDEDASEPEASLLDKLMLPCASTVMKKPAHASKKVASKAKVIKITPRRERTLMSPISLLPSLVFA